MKVITKCEKSQGKGSTLSDWSAVAEMNQTRLENTFGRKLQPTKSRAKLHFFISHSGNYEIYAGRKSLTKFWDICRSKKQI